jgi:NAD(P)-dependent dehydrogenase (short-subunit alcohol dehydrogenase family)
MSLPLGTYPLPTFAHHAMDLAGKIAIVTGASRSNGIGARIAHCLAEKGADVALVYTSEASTSEANIVKQHILGLGRRAILIKTDLAQQNCGEIVLRETLEGFGGKNVDILVNNATIIRGESLGEFGVKKIDSLGNDTRTPARHSTLGFDPDDFNQ